MGPIIDLKMHPDDSIERKAYKRLMQKQIQWCRNHADLIVRRANKVYCLVTGDPPEDSHLWLRCLKFNKLENYLEKASHK